MEQIKACIYDTEDGNYKPAILDGLNKINFKNIIKSDDNILIKPNLTWTSYKKGVTTNPSLLDDLTAILKNYANKVYIGESDGANSAWSANQCFKGHNLYNMAKLNGFELINLTKKPSIFREVSVDNVAIKLKVSKFILDKIDVLITVPVLKVHALTIVSLGLKNQWGCLPDPMRLLYHPFIHKGIVAVNKIYKPKISLIDATYGLNRSGPIFGDPIKINKLFISNDVTALDILTCAFMGISYEKVRHMNIAKEEFLKNFELHKIIKYGEFTKKFDFNLKRSFYDTVSNFIYLHKEFNNLFYASFFSKYIQRILQFYKILFKKENIY